MVDRKKVIHSLVALVTLLTSVILAFGTAGKAVPGFAQPLSGVTATDYLVPTKADPWWTAFDSNGHVWVALPGCDPSPTCSNSTPPGALGVFNPASRTWMTSYTLPSGYGQPLFLAFDQQGMLWFPMPMSNSIGQFNPTTHTFQQWTVPTAGSGPWAVAIDSSGNVWFTEHYTNKIGPCNPSNHTFVEISTPASNSQPYGITVDSLNNVWFTENNSSVALIAK